MLTNTKTARPNSMRLSLPSAELLPCRVVGDPLQSIFNFGKSVVQWSDEVLSFFEELPGLDPWRWDNFDPTLVMAPCHPPPPSQGRTDRSPARPFNASSSKAAPLSQCAKDSWARATRRRLWPIASV